MLPPSRTRAMESRNHRAREIHRSLAVMQTVSLFTVFGIASLYLLLPLLSLRDSFNQGSGPLAMLAGLSIAAFEAFLIVTAISIIAKWTLIGRYREGNFPLWGAYYWRFWLVRRIGALVPLTYMRGTPLLAIYLRALGAKIGPGVHLGTTHLHASDLITDRWRRQYRDRCAASGLFGRGRHA